uniref:Uncharacterized protein n=1 Tax=Panagrolaimus davidi TaxID=227884 RepID=A0A914PCH8_9BILA
MSADTGHNAFHLGFEQLRRLKLFTELFICTICPLPGSGTVEWPVLSSPAAISKKAEIPLHVILTLPMFLRMYLVARYIVLHSFTTQVISRLENS